MSASESTRESATAADVSVRRIVALYLPELLCELAVSTQAGPIQAGPIQAGQTQARGAAEHRRPFGVVLREAPEAGAGAGASGGAGASAGEGPAEGELLPTAPLAAVSVEARRLGLAAGQTIAEARAVVAGLEVRTVGRARIRAALAAVAEVALGFGITAAIEASAHLGDGSSSVADTVWVDITGTAHLFGGEPELLVELASAVRELGHGVRVGVAEGPLLARALARWAVSAPREIGGIATPARVAALPVLALPIGVERAAWLMQLGVQTLGELGALPRADVASRLAGPPRASRRQSGAGELELPAPDPRLVLDLCHGRDPTPLVPYQPPRSLTEEVSFEHPVAGIEPLKFALRGLTARVAARLCGRGEAAPALALSLALDAAVARLAGCAPRLELAFDLASPLWREQDLYRALGSRLERLELRAPTVAVRLTVPSVTERSTRQLDLSRVSGGSFAGARNDDALPVLLAELAGDIGAERVGLLHEVDSHRPEAQTLLVSLATPRGSAARGQGGREAGTRGRGARHRREEPMEKGALAGHGAAGRGVDGRADAASAGRARNGVGGLAVGAAARTPLRVFAHPVPLTAALQPGSAIFVGGRAFTVARIDFERRLEAVEWWSERPTSRDYYRLLLRGTEGVLEISLYVDRNTGARYLQGIYD